uniref:MFS transporter permease n=1 Tax=Pseudomonas fluorescens TaxID=294 RepID=A0A220ITQ1_PSEFL|nr:Putative MFS transporter permease [Pseudomonas fluorescens]
MKNPRSYRADASYEWKAVTVAACNRKQPCSQSTQFSAQINCD